MPDAPILVIALPLLTAFVGQLISLTPLKRINRYLPLLGLASALFFLLSMSGRSLSGSATVYALGGWPAPVGISLWVDGLGFLIALIAIILAILATLYSIGCLKCESGFYSLILIMTGGMLGVALTRDLFNMYVFFEIMGVSAYILVAYKRDRESLRASFKYLLLGSIATLFLLLGIGILYRSTGTLDMGSIGLKLTEVSNPGLVKIALILFIVAFGVKCGMVPLHTWVPDAHSLAPTPVSVLLSGVVLKVGAYALLRTQCAVFAISGSRLLALLGSASLILGAALALVQSDLKRMLAYSSINQIGVIIIGIGLGTELALTGSLLHILNHAVMKGCLFFCAGIVIQQTGMRRIDQLKGLAQGSPWLAIAFTIAALSIIGVPPLGGFFSKYYVSLAAIQAGYGWKAALILLMSLLSAVYYLKVLVMFLRPGILPTQKPSPLMSVPAYSLALCCVLLGLLPVLELIRPTVSFLLR